MPNTTVATIGNGKNKVVKDQGLPQPKKKRGVAHIFRVALYLLRRKSNKTKASMQVDVSSKGPWTKVLGSMRPFHTQSTQCPPLSPSNDKPVVAAASMVEQFEEVFTPPLSPAAAKPLSSSSSENDMSQYASANNLQELDTSAEYIEYNDNDSCGDEMIDVKAEEFITQFYEQMRLQHVQYTDGHNMEVRRTS